MQGTFFSCMYVGKTGIPNPNPITLTQNLGIKLLQNGAPIMHVSTFPSLYPAAIATAMRLLYIPYSRKIWRELNLVKSPKTAKIKYWRNINLAIVYGEGYDVIT